MGEVAEMFDLNITTIRFWESRFPILKPHRNKKGNRLFTSKDIENLKIIYNLVKERGMTIEGANMALKDNRDELLRKSEIIERLQDVRSMLLEIRQELGFEEGNDIEVEEPAELEHTQIEIQEEVEPIKDKEEAETKIEEEIESIETETKEQETEQEPIEVEKDAETELLEYEPQTTVLDQTLF